MSITEIQIVGTVRFFQCLSRMTSLGTFSLLALDPFSFPSPLLIIISNRIILLKDAPSPQMVNSRQSAVASLFLFAVFAVTFHLAAANVAIWYPNPSYSSLYPLLNCILYRLPSLILLHVSKSLFFVRSIPFLTFAPSGPQHTGTLNQDTFFEVGCSESSFSIGVSYAPDCKGYGGGDQRCDCDAPDAYSINFACCTLSPLSFSFSFSFSLSPLIILFLCFHIFSRALVPSVVSQFHYSSFFPLFFPLPFNNSDPLYQRVMERAATRVAIEVVSVKAPLSTHLTSSSASAASTTPSPL